MLSNTNKNNLGTRHPEIATVKKEQTKALMKLVSELQDPKEKKMLCMYFGFYNGRCFSIAEIAKEMNLEASTVHSTITAVVAKLRLALLVQGSIDPDDIKPGKGLR